MVAVLAHDVATCSFRNFLELEQGWNRWRNHIPQTDTNSRAPAVLKSFGCEVGIDGDGAFGKGLFPSKVSKKGLDVGHCWGMSAVPLVMVLLMKNRRPKTFWW